MNPLVDKPKIVPIVLDTTKKVDQVIELILLKLSSFNQVNKFLTECYQMIEGGISRYESIDKFVKSSLPGIFNNLLQINEYARQIKDYIDFANGDLPADKTPIDYNTFKMAAFDMFNLLQVVINETTQTYSILSNPKYYRQILLGFSGSYMEKYKFKVTNADNLLAAIKRTSIDDNPKIYEMLYFSITVDAAKIPELIHTISLISDSNSFVVFCIKKLFTNPELTKEQTAELTQKVESLKDTVLGVKANYKSSNASASIIEQQIVKYNLLPFMFYTTAENVFLKLRELTISTAGDIQGLTADINVIVIQHSSPYYLEYNIKSFIDLDYVENNQLGVSVKSGVNNRLIKRFNYITEIMNSGENSENAIKFYENKSSDKVIIFDILNSNMFRLLSLDANSPVIELLKVRGLVDGLSMRNANYNKIVENLILERGINIKYRRMINAFEDEKDNDISNATFCKLVVGTIKESLLNTFPVETPKEFKDIKFYHAFLYGKTAEKIISDSIYVVCAGMSRKLLNVQITSEDNITKAIISTDLSNKFISVFATKMKERLIVKQISNITIKENSYINLKNLFIGIFLDICKITLDEMSIKPSLLDEIDYNMKQFAITGMYF